MSPLKYKRIVLKISGEALAGTSGFGIDISTLRYIADEITPILKEVEIGIVLGGGNLFRGRDLDHFDRVSADHMGMLATISNALALREVFKDKNIETAAMSALPIMGVIPPYDREQALQLLSEGKVLIFAGGTGNPLVTTDTTLSLRGIELKADLLLKATNVDGVYSANPKIDPGAKLYSKLSYKEALANDLAVMDSISFCMCKDHDMTLRVYNMNKVSALKRIILGEEEGTLVTN